MNRVVVFFFVFISSIFGVVSLGPRVSAQVQEYTFSGNAKDNYQCYAKSSAGDLITFEPSDVKDSTGRWLCYCVGKDAPFLSPTTGEYVCRSGSGQNVTLVPAVQAVLKPPKFQQLEVWFVRVVYVIWALTATFSFFFLVVLGYQYMISQNDPTKITEIRQKIVNYIIGFVLVFLAVPVLSTIFRLLGINTAVQCYDVEMPGFQFFFTDLCTTANGLVKVTQPDGTVIEVNPRDV